MTLNPPAVFCSILSSIFSSILFSFIFLTPNIFAENLLRDGALNSLEEADSPWNLIGNHESAHRETEGENHFLHVETSQAGMFGVVQTIVFEKPISVPLRFGGKARVHGNVASSADGKSPDFDVYIDAFYEDGQPLWGVKALFSPQETGWQKAEGVIWPQKPIQKIQVFVLFRDYTGCADFDDIYLEELPFTLENLRAVGGLTGNGSVALSGRLGWKKEFLPPNFTCICEMKNENSTAESPVWTPIPLEFQPDGVSFFASFRPCETPGIKTFRFTVSDGEKIILQQTLPCDTTARNPQFESGKFSLWLESSMKRIYFTSLPDENFPARPSISLDAAQNEAESFQIAALSDHEISDVILTFSDLISECDSKTSISAKNLDWKQVGFISTPKIHEHPEEPNGCTAWFPDLLLPRETGFIPANRTVSFWVTISVPSDASAGTYTGKIGVRSKTDSNVNVEIPVRVQVWPVRIPAENHLGNAFALMDGFLEKAYGPQADIAELRKTYDSFMVQYRLMPEGDISRTEMPSLERLKEWKDRGLGYFNILNMVPSRGTNAWRCNASLDFYTPENREKIREELRPYIAKLREAGLVSHAYIYTFDESRKEFHPAMTDFFGMVKEEFPEVATFTTAYIGVDTEKMKELNVDWCCPLTSVYNREKAEECRKNGQKIWSYICCGPNFPYANIMCRFPLIEGRVLGWQSFEQNYDGLLYWGVNIWSDRTNTPINPNSAICFDWNTGWKLGETWIYGDGRLLYPCADGSPIGSTRLANLRDGFEEYELLRLLALKNPKLAEEICKEVSASPIQFTRDPNVIQAQKRRVLEAISVQ